VEVGIASYYAHEFDGRRTASGEVYDMNKLTAAHPSLPFGTIVKVTNLENEKSVEVRINDRGPFKKARVIDVSYEAAKRLDFVRQGLVEVRVEAIGKG
jgi:rare lipoprotein A